MTQIIPFPTPDVSRTCPESTSVHTLEQEAAYRLAFALVMKIDADLDCRGCHYRNGGGELLTTLDEVIRAILDGDLAAVEFAPKAREDVVTGLLREHRRREKQFYQRKRAVLRRLAA